MDKKTFLTAREAASALDISLPTLYSYVSRGMLHSEQVTGDSRIRRYRREDVLRLTERKELRRNPAKAAAQILRWGSPVLESGLTLISNGRFFYRGKDAVELARSATVEEVAALLWTGDSSQAKQLFVGQPLRSRKKLLHFVDKIPKLGPIGSCQQALSLGAATDPSAHNLTSGAVARTGARILVSLYSAVCATSAWVPLDLALTDAWIPSRRSAAQAIRAALILCADHELNVSAFTARCIASAQATPYEVVLGALAAFSGRRHGGASEEVRALFNEAEGARQYRSLLARRLRLAGHIPGFGHPLYTEGDPRARLLIDLSKIHGRSSATKIAENLIHAGQDLTGDYPNLDFGLVTLAYALGLPPDAAITLFALGRTVGWIAHAIEQYADNQLIRPRASYVGPIPDAHENSVPGRILKMRIGSTDTSMISWKPAHGKRTSSDD